MARIGYARVSTRSQNDDSQVDDLTAYGCDKIFADTASGKHAARPELDKALAYLREGTADARSEQRLAAGDGNARARCRVAGDLRTALLKRVEASVAEPPRVDTRVLVIRSLRGCPAWRLPRRCAAPGRPPSASRPPGPRAWPPRG